MTHSSWEVLTDGGVGVDVGAKLDGDDYVGMMLAAVGSFGKVYGFEPDPAGFAKLKEAYGDKPNVILEQKAVTNEDGPVPLIRDGSHYSLVHKGSSGLTAEGVTLDSYFKDTLKVDCVKVDVEGGEYKVLMGAREIIRRNPQIKFIVEMHQNILDQNGISEQKMAGLVEELGLDVLLGGGTWLLGTKGFG